MTSPAITAETVELLQTMIRNGCVNDGTPSSGFEHRNADTLHAFLGDAGFDVARFEPTAGRVSLVARIEGREPGAPSLCLMGHTDVVPVNPDGWTPRPVRRRARRRPSRSEVWGRGAIDMLNLTASMAVAFRQLRREGFRPRGDLIYFAVADEESGSAHGARWMADHERRRDPRRLRAHRERRPALRPGGGAATSASTSARRASRGAGCACAARPGHGSMPFEATTRS